MNLMRLLRIAIIAVFTVTLALFGWYWYRSEIKADKSVPVITLDSDEIEVEPGASDEVFLAGVTAYDKKDGDLTDRVIVESISKFTEPGLCKVYYAVCDNDNHVAGAFRKVRYRGYVSPRFYLKRSLCFAQMESVNAGSAIGVTDMLDGDISDNVIITSQDYEYGVTGVYNIKAEAANSMGDRIVLQLPLIVEERSINAPAITLTDYLIYVKKGTRIDPTDYFVSAQDSYENDVSDTLHLEYDYDPDTEGVYSIHYYATDSLDRRGHTVLLVVVE